MSVRSTAITAAVVLLSALVPISAAEHSAASGLEAKAKAAAAAANPVDYAYDAAGQLKGVSQSAAGSSAARYTYDPGGNVTSIDRSASSTVSIQSLVPARGAAGTTVTVSGTGFATTTTGNTVRFNGTAATVTAATATALTVAVPTGATTGTVSVTASATTATSADTFTVDTPRATLAVSSVSPAIGVPGTQATVTGTGFDPTAANDVVTFGLTRAVITAATNTSLTVTVPNAATSGRVTVAAGTGVSASSSTDFVVVPKGYTVADVGPTAVATPDGTASTVNIATSGTVALLRFSGVKGQRLSLGLTGSSISTEFTVGAFTPYGAPFARGDYDAARTFSSLYGGLELPPLPSTGVYQIVLDPSGTGTGSVTATLSTRATGTLSLTGSGTTVALSRAGQQAELSLPATAGQPLNLGFTSSGLATAATGTLTLREPNGTPLLWSAPGSTRGLVRLNGSGDFDFTPALTGTYTVILGVTDSTTGSITVTASPPLASGALTLGTDKAVTVGRPGQNSVLTYSGTAGQKLSFDFTAYNVGYLPYLTVVSPDGTTLSATQLTGYHQELPALPTTGTYTITVSTFSATGSFTARLTTVADAGTISASGSSVSVSMPQAGLTTSLTFSATSGQVLAFGFSGWTLPSAARLTASVVDPAGTVVERRTVASLGEFWFTPRATGTFRLLLTANDATSTGSVTVTLSPELAGGALAIGTPKPVSTTRPGQSTRLTFTATANQRLSLNFASYTFAHAGGVMIIKPDGTVLQDDVLTATQLDLEPLATAGTYQVVFYPYAETGSTQLALVERVDAGTTTVNGTAKTLTVSQTGRYAETSFTATASQRLTFGFTNTTFATGTTLRARLINSTGTTIADSVISAGGAMEATAPAAGTYRLIIGPSGYVTGSTTLTLSTQVADGAFTLNTAKTVTFTRPGQSHRVTFAGTAGQNLQLAFTNVTNAYFPNVLVTKPDGTTLMQNAGAATVSVTTLPTTGTYEFVFNPYSSTGGAATIKLSTRAAAASTKAAPAGPTALSRTPAMDQPKVAAVPPSRKAALPKRPPGNRPDFQSAVTTPASETWTPDERNLSGKGWTTRRTDAAPARSARQAKKGVTALTGRILTLDGKALPRTTLSIDGTRTTSDAHGQFLLTGLNAGHRVLRVDGSSAGTATRRFGLYDIGVDLVAGRTTALPYTIWMTRLDTAHEVTFTSPTAKEVVVTNPAVPGLEVRLPAGATVRDVGGKTVTKLGITAIPIDRSPFPLPKSNVPVYFTVQPGSSYVFPTGARVIYPNYTKARAGTTFNFWHYDPADRGWFVYGHGKVSSNGRQVVPDADTKVYQFTGAMLIEPGEDPPPGTASTADGGTPGADPVDLATGLFTDSHTDLTVEDTQPISITRSYNQADTGRRAFGIGVNVDYNMYLYSEQQWVDGWLILPNSARVHYHRITPGGTGSSDYLTAAFAADPTPTRFNGSVLAWNGDGFDIRLRDGTTYVFGEEAPLQAIRDRYGNTTTITRDPASADTDGIVRPKGPITQITSPNGKWIALSYDSSNRVTRAKDNTGRTVSYTYDANGFLSTVTDAGGGVTTYTYASGRIATIKDPRGTVYLTNAYDAAGRVSKQTLADGTTYQIAYTTNAAGKVTETRLTDPRGNVRRVTFNAAGFSTSDTAAYGTSSAQTTTVTRDATSNLPTVSVDALNRRSEMSYDTHGNLTSVTQLAGTAAARTAQFVYAGPYDQLSRATDWLGHATSYTYATDGALRTVTDPLSQTTTYDTAENGLVTKRTDNLAHATSYAYLFADPSSSTDPLGRVTRTLTDGVGRVVATIDPTGSTTRNTYNDSDQVLTSTDPIGRVTAFQYDPNGNLTKSTDARGNATSYTYDLLDRLTASTDPLGRIRSVGYDANGNVTSGTSPRGQVTGYTYDGLNRRVTARFGVSGSTSDSQISYTYDAGNRLTSVVDSTGGTLSLTTNDLDDVTRAVSPQGQVDYTYDLAGRRTGMTVTGQPQVVYSYNNNDQITGLTRGSNAVTLGYDGVGRRTSQTLPGSLTQAYTYDAADQITDIGYTQGSTTLGNLAYSYDRAGRPTHIGGSFARADVPAAYGPATYDAAGQLTSVDGTTYSYDANGSLTSDGTTSYTWNAREQLTATARSGLAATYGYDGLGRRSSRTVAGTATNYLFDGLDPVQELTGGTVSANLLTGGLDEVFSRITSSTSSLLTDALGSTIAVTDGSGALAGEYSYQPFGATTVTGADQANPTRFTGRDDDQTGLYYYRNRYYSPGTQRFISADPLGINSGDANPYAYVTNQPTTLTDALGTKPRENASRLDVGTYKYLAARSVKDGMTPDHIPSFAAIRESVEASSGRKLTTAEAKALRENTNTILIDTKIHADFSRTYKGRNTKQQIANDAKDLRAAADLDLAALRPHLLAAGVSEADLDTAIAKLHQLNQESGRYP